MARPTPPSGLAQALGHAATDKRIDILRRVGAAGSISEAARAAGVSYKAAWQAIETLGNLAGTALVAKVVGGSGGGGARLTEAGQRLLAGAQTLAQARATLLAGLDEGASAPRVAPGLAGLALRTSMRNHLPCRITRLRPTAGMLRVELDPGGGATLVARITRESAQLLGLQPGLPVLALCKATAVAVGARLDAREGANLLPGTVRRASGARQGGEVTLALASGQALVGFAAAAHGLRAAMPAMAQVDEAALVIGLAG